MIAGLVMVDLYYNMHLAVTVSYTFDCSIIIAFVGQLCYLPHTADIYSQKTFFLKSNKQVCLTLVHCHICNTDAKNVTFFFYFSLPMLKATNISKILYHLSL